MPLEQERERAHIALATPEFLAKGGKIQVIPAGFTTYEKSKIALQYITSTKRGSRASKRKAKCLPPEA